MSRFKEASDFVRDGDDALLSVRALIELIKAVADKGHSFRLQAPGFSMSPFIRNLDTITISPLPQDKPGLGDVVAAVLPGEQKLVVHRVIGAKYGCYVIKGDNTLQTDGLVPRSCIIGYVTRVERDEKKITLGLGYGRVPIALMSRKNVLSPILFQSYRLIHLIHRRMKT